MRLSDKFYEVDLDVPITIMGVKGGVGAGGGGMTCLLLVAAALVAMVVYVHGDGQVDPSTL
ncbi:MAG: hypothetical protein U9N46_07425 [Euryarchaeota archaeon]|nr:MAG: hypothetical protein C5S47_06120 [ANME-2 cluster archaeon]MEA1865011.1 hypothetical protein [Euryarchaeota archaeon]